MLVLGIDPGLGVKSPMGIAAIDTSDFSILLTKNLWTKGRKDPLRKKLRGLAGDIRTHVDDLGGFIDLVSSEYFVMRAKGGESLQRLVGALMVSVPAKEWVEVQNSTVKRALSGYGGSKDKKAVARGVEEFFEKRNTDSAKVVSTLIYYDNWDILDALAIGITGYLEVERRKRYEAKEQQGK